MLFSFNFSFYQVDKNLQGSMDINFLADLFRKKNEFTKIMTSGGCI